MIRLIKLREYERGLLFRNQAFRRLLGPGWHVILDPLFECRIERHSVKEPWIRSQELNLVIRAGALEGQAEVLDLAEHQRALVWIDGRFATLLSPGLYALWTCLHKIRVEILDLRKSRFEHPDLPRILVTPEGARTIQSVSVDPGCVGLFYKDGRFVEELGAGRYAFWRDSALISVMEVDLREQSLDIGGQEIITADKVSLRLNAVVSYRVTDAKRAVDAVDDYTQALYRDAQLALRAVIGSRELDLLLTDKDSVASELESMLSARASRYALEVIALGIKDVILPGEIRTMLNRVTEARQAAEANVITRREEVSAMRSQASTARILASNPTLMKLKELEVLEKVAGQSKLTLVLGEKGLADRLTNLI